jgi:hypothetical protein
MEQQPATIHLTLPLLIGVHDLSAAASASETTSAAG